jgi:hypothetical protein
MFVSDSPAAIGPGYLGLTYENLDYSPEVYKKTYQSFILNKDDSGRLFLVVAGTETDNSDLSNCFFNMLSNQDVVDYFELPGRPLLPNRNVR